jgi:hypothetical protein
MMVPLRCESHVSAEQFLFSYNFNLKSTLEIEKDSKLARPVPVQQLFVFLPRPACTGPALRFKYEPLIFFNLLSELCAF